MVLPIFTKAAQGGNPADPAADIADQPIQEYLAEKSSQDLVANFADSFKNAHDEGTRRHENELLTGVRMGLLDPSQVNMRVNADGMRQITQAAEKVRKDQSNSTFMFLSLLDQIDAQIQEHRDYFQAKYGDDWRDKLGKSIAGDDYPKQRPGESDKDYHDRFDQWLFKTVCNPDGTLKDDYKDHSDADRFRQIGKTYAAMNKMEAARSRAIEFMEDPNLTEDEIMERLRELDEDVIDELRHSENKEVAVMAKKVFDDRHAFEGVTASSADNDSFLAMT